MSHRQFDVLSFRNRLGLSQKQLGKHLGVTGRTVARWQHGLTTPDPYYVRLMAKLEHRHILGTLHERPVAAPKFAARLKRQIPETISAIGIGPSSF